MVLQLYGDQVTPSIFYKVAQVGASCRQGAAAAGGPLARPPSLHALRPRPGPQAEGVGWGASQSAFACRRLPTCILSGA